MDTKKSASWLVEQARAYMKEGDAFAAKSWLLTAKTLFPDAFSVQHEELQMERRAGKVARCGRLFYDMICSFPKEPTLWDELAKIFHAQDSSVMQNSETAFLKEMFDTLPEINQRDLLLKYANHQTDLVEKCRISLLVLKRFKGAVKDQGVSLIKILKDAEDKEYPGIALNIYRKMIVCDVIPLLLKSADTHVTENPRKSPKHKSTSLYITEDQMICYLNWTMEFFLNYAIHKGALSQHWKTEVTPEVSSFELDDAVSSWHWLHENLVLFAGKLGWSNVLKFKDKIDPSKSRALKSRWKTLYNARDTNPPLGVFYSVVPLYLFAVLEYCSFISSSSANMKSHSGPVSNQELILVENIEQMSQKESVHQSVIRAPKKRKRNDSGSMSSEYQSSSEDVTVIINPGLIGHVSDTLGECLQVAIDCRKYLRGTFPQEFGLVSKQWRMDRWAWMQAFHVDSSLFQGRYRDLVDMLEEVSLPDGDSKNTPSLKQCLQLASCLFCIGEHKQACQRALQAVTMLNSSSLASADGHVVDDRPPSKNEGRSLLVLSSNFAEVLSYCAQIAFSALKARLYSPDTHQDALVGHLIVLSQLHWQKNEEVFESLLSIIMAKERYVYNHVFEYIINIDILEEFAYLHANDLVTFETSTTEETNSKRTVTRGVNKGLRGDFTALLQKQVQRSGEFPASVVHAFLRNEQELILALL